MGYVCTWKLFQCYAERVADAGHIEGYYSLPTHVNCLLQRGLGQRLPAERFWNQTSLIPNVCSLSVGLFGPDVLSPRC